MGHSLKKLFENTMKQFIILALLFYAMELGQSCRNMGQSSNNLGSYTGILRETEESCPHGCPSSDMFYRCKHSGSNSEYILDCANQNCLNHIRDASIMCQP